MYRFVFICMCVYTYGVYITVILLLFLQCCVVLWSSTSFIDCALVGVRLHFSLNDFNHCFCV